MSDQEFIYLVNLTKTKLSLKGGFLTLNPHGHAKRVKGFEKDESIEYAINRNWLKVTDKAPKSPEDGMPTAISDYFETNKGMSKEELQAELLKGKGQTISDAIDMSAVSKAAEDAVPLLEETPEPATTKRTRKAATETTE